MARVCSLAVRSLWTFALIAVLAPRAPAQNGEWSAQLIVQPYPSPYLAEWQRNPHTAILSVFYTGSEARSFRIEGVATSLQKGELARARSQPYVLAGGPTTQIFTSDEVPYWAMVSKNTSVFDATLRTGILPEGRHRICARLLDEGDVPLAEACADFTIQFPSAPELIAPGNRSFVDVLQPVFQWTPIIAPPELGVGYRFRLVERYPTQTAQAALDANRAHYETVVQAAPILAYPLDALPLEDGREYVWQVEAVDGAGNALGTGGSRSEIWSFTRGDPLNPPNLVSLPDEIALVPGVAVLRGLSAVSASTNGTRYVLNGTARLELLAPFNATLAADLEGLELEATSLEPPLFQGGRLTARPVAGSMAKASGGLVLDFGLIRYEPRTGLLVSGAQITGPGGAIIPLSGALTITSGGVRGLLAADAPLRAPLLVLGAAPVRYLVRRLEVSYPAASVALTGALELFGRTSSGCEDVRSVPADGPNLVVAVKCAPGLRLPLVPGESSLTIALAQAQGTLSVSREEGLQDYSLDLGGELEVALFGSGTTYRLPIGIFAEPEGVRPTRVASASAGSGSVDAGPLRIAPSSLRVERLAYANATGGWDFELRFDATPNLAPFGNLALPTVQVTVGAAGVTIPAVSAAWPNAAPAEVGGFQVRPLAFRSETIRLPWPGSGTLPEFDFGALDLQIGFAASAPELLRYTQLVAKDVKYRAGVLTGTIEQQNFSPSIPLQFHPNGLGFALESLGGTLSRGESGQNITVTTSGTLMLPDFLSCSAAPTGRLGLGNTRLAFSSAGYVIGSVSNVVVPCPLALGPLAIRVQRANLGFTAGSSAQNVELDLTGDLELPGPETGSVVRASGTLAFDLAGKRVLRGGIDVIGPFRWALPAEQPFVTLLVSRARLDATGFAFTGSGSLALTGTGSSTATVAFENFKLALPDFNIAGGRARISGAFSVAADLTDNGIAWGTEQHPGSPEPNKSGELVLDSEGVHVTGEAAAELSLSDYALRVDVKFANDFLLQWNSDAGVRVGRGRAGFWFDQTEVAYVDQSGFWFTNGAATVLGDEIADLLFGDDFKLPDRIGLPTENIAYLQIGQNGQLNVDATMGPAGVRIQTRAGSSIDLVVPALGKQGEQAPAVGIAFDVVVDPGTLQVAGGQIHVEAKEGGASLFDTETGGVTLSVRKLTYDLAGGSYRLKLQATANVKLVDGTPIQLTGDIEATSLGISGTLTATPGAGAVALASLGRDPVRLLLQKAVLTLPEGTLDVAGGLELFGRDAKCAANLTGASLGSAMTVSASCMPGIDIPLVADASDVWLKLRSVSGSLTLDPGNASLGHDLKLGGQLQLAKTDNGGSCGALFDVKLANGNVSVDPSTLSAQCGGIGGDIGFGWMDGKPANLTLEKLSYTPAAGFDFRLKLDLDLSVRDIISIPTLASIVADPQGVHVPALDTDMTHAPIELGGFGLKFTHVKTAAVTIAWRDWQVHSADDFEFSFAAQLSLPRLPQGSPACLATSSFGTTNVTLGKRKLTVDLGEHTFSPPCAITLTAGVPTPQTTLSFGGLWPFGGGDDEATSQEPVGSDPSEWALPPFDGQGEGELPPPPLVEARDRWPSKDSERQALVNAEKAPVLAIENEMREKIYADDCDGDGDKNDPDDEKCRNALREKYEKAQSEMFEKWAERDIGELRDKMANCLAYQRQITQSGGVVDENSDAYKQACDNENIRQLQEQLKTQVIPRWQAVGTCDVEQSYAVMMQLGLEREKQLLGAAEESTTATDAITQAISCRSKFEQELREVCAAPNKLAVVRWHIAKALGAERQAQLLGAAEEDASAAVEVIGNPQSCKIIDLPSGSGSSTGGSAGLDSADSPAPWWAGTDASALSGPFSPDLIDGAALYRDPLVNSRTQNFTVDHAARAPPEENTVQVRLELERIGGQLVIGFAPFLVVERIPEVEGAVVLPQAVFTCSDPKAERVPLMSKLRLGPHGDLSGTILGFVPPCPIELPGVRLAVTSAALTFNTKQGSQSAILRARVDASFTASDTPAKGTGALAFDLLRAQIIDGSVTFQGPLNVGLPRKDPVLTFELNEAKLDKDGVHMDGRAKLLLPQSKTIGVTFDNVTVNTQTLALTKGRVLFDQPFAFEVGVGGEGVLSWKAVEAGSPLTISAGVRADLPTQLVLSPAGFAANGSGAARLIYQGQDLASLTASFSQDFRMALSPVGVTDGRVDIRLNNNTVAYIDALGFHANLLAFGLSALPKRLPLPSEDIAYIELRDANDNLRVQVETTDGKVRVYTAQGMATQLVVPALRMGRAQDPKLDVTFDITLDPATAQLASGSIQATVPQGNAAFDLSGVGVPFAMQSLSYDNPGNGYRFAFAGQLLLFGERQGASSSVTLTLDGSGKLAGQVALQNLKQESGLAANSDKLVLELNAVNGSFNTDVRARSIWFELDATGAVALKDGSTQLVRVPATVRVRHDGVQVTNLQVQSTQAFTLPASELVELRLANLRVPLLGYTASTGWQFELLFDAALRFPTLNQLTVGPLQNISLKQNGFTIPAFEITELASKLAAAQTGSGNALQPAMSGVFDLGGFALTPLAFRMDAVTYNWFTGQGPSDWGFGFDFEVAFANLHAQAPDALKNLKLRVLDAGLRNGKPHGTLERVAFNQPVDAGIAKISELFGKILPADATQDIQANGGPVVVEAVVAVKLPFDLPVCNANIDVADDTLAFSSEGWIRGSISNITPSCPSNLGPFKFEFGPSELRFAASSNAQSVALKAQATVEFPGINEGDVVRASGAVDFAIDVATRTGQLVYGEIAVSQPFRWLPKDNNPFLSFNVSSAKLNASGLHFSGSGKLRLGDGATTDVTFNDLTFGLPDLRVKSGSATFLNQFAVGTTIDSIGQMKWGAFAPNAPRPAGWGFRVVVPANLTLDAAGLGVAGSATAELSYRDSVYQAISATFLNSFTVGLEPVAIKTGKMELRRNQDLIAHADSSGFWPGNLFGVLPIPAKLGLADTATAYIALRDQSNQLVVTTEFSAQSLRIRTQPQKAAQLVIPALKDPSTNAIPIINVQFDVQVNTTTYQVMSGSIKVTAPDGAPALFSLAQFGVPLEIRELTYAPVQGQGQYALMIDAHARLPKSLGSALLKLDDVTVTKNGLSGAAELGTYKSLYDAQLPIVATTLLYPDTAQKQQGTTTTTTTPPDTVWLELTGARVTFGGSNNGLKVSGAIRASMFTKDTIPGRLFVTGDVNASGVTLTADPSSLPDGKFPIGSSATFEPLPIGADPAIALTASLTELTVKLNGTLRVPNFKDDFAVTVTGLQVGTRGIELQSISMKQPSEWQSFEAFGAKFTLKDSLNAATQAVVYPAMSLSYASRVLKVTLTGAIELFENTTRFYGLEIGTDGNVSIAAVSLISQPLVVVQNVLSIDKLLLESKKLKATASVTLPAPLDGPGAQQLFFAIAADGTVEGGGTVVAINETTPGLGSADNTEYALGPVVTIDPRYLGLKLDFANLKQNSAVEVVADFYVENAAQKRIKVGDLNGGTVLPGLRIGFDKSVQWGNVALADTFSFGYEMLRIGLQNVTAAGTLNSFAIGIDGSLGVDLPSVAGRIAFTGFEFKNDGTLKFGQVTGGSLSIAGYVSLEVSGFQYSNTPTTIGVSGGAMPSGSSAPSGSTDQLQVLSYVRFGATISILGEPGSTKPMFGGGVKDFLVYQTAGEGTTRLTSMLIDDAVLDIQNVVSMTADLRYQQQQNGFELVLGGSAKVMGTVGLTVVGALAQESNEMRMGVFLAASGLKGLYITPASPAAEVTGLGGGFFYRPKQEWITLVKTAANVQGKAGGLITPPEPGQFAVMLYGELAVPPTPTNVADGRVLLTLGPNGMMIDGMVNVLKQGEKLQGEAHLVVGFKKAYAEGNILLDVQYGALATGSGTLEFGVYPNTWIVKGDMELTVVGILKANGNLFAGPPGFLASLTVKNLPPFYIVTIQTIDATVFYSKANSLWGGKASAIAGVSPIPGFAPVSATLAGAIIAQGVQVPLLYAVAGITVDYIVDKWEGTVWAKMQNGEMSAGTGRDPAMEQALKDAIQIAQKMENAKQQSQAAVTAAKNDVKAAPITLSDAELATAYRNLSALASYTPSGGVAAVAYILGFAIPIGIETIYAPQGTAEANYLAQYFEILKQTGGPSDSADIRQYGSIARYQESTLDAQRPTVESRIAAIKASLAAAGLGPAPSIPTTDPLTVSSAPIAIQTSVNADGDTVATATGGPTFQVNVQALNSLTQALQQHQADTEKLDQQARDNIAALESSLTALRAVTTDTSSGSLLTFARAHAQTLSAVELQFAAHTDFLERTLAWNYSKYSWLKNQQASYTTILHNKSAQLKNSARDPNLTASQRLEAYTQLETLAWVRVKFLSGLTGNTEILNTFVAETASTYKTRAQREDLYQQKANDAGFKLWHQVAVTGLTTAAQTVSKSDLLTLKTAATSRLGAIRNAHQKISGALSDLFDSQVELTGLLSDLYDRYIYWKEAQSPTSSTAVKASGPLMPVDGGIPLGTQLVLAQPSSSDPLASFKTRKAEFAQQLSVPKLASAQVTVTSRKNLAEVKFEWSGSHPNGLYEFRFRESGNMLADLTYQGLLSNGRSGSFTSYRASDIHCSALGCVHLTLSQTRTFQAGVRGGAGFLGLGFANFSVRVPPIMPSGTPPNGSVVVVNVKQEDWNPPPAPTITFPTLTQTALGVWTRDRSGFDISWSTSDPISGISEYQYAVGTAPGDTSVRGWTTAGGRMKLRLERLPLTETTPLYVAVKAKNGADMWSPVGVSSAIRVDAMPPAFASDAALQAGPGVKLVVTNPLPLAGRIMTLQSGTLGVTTVMAEPPITTVAACVVPMPPYPVTDFGAVTAAVPAPLTATAVPPTGASAQFTHPQAVDQLSSIRAYYFRVDTIRPTQYTEQGWSAVGSQATFTVTDPLDYQRQFYISVVAVDYAGNASAPLSYGPFTLIDATPPSDPSFCARPGSVANQLAVRFSTVASDAQTGVVGYEYRVATESGTVLRDWPATSDWTGVQSGSIKTTAPLSLTEGGRYRVDVRAINGQGQKSNILASGPVIYDLSAPPAPIITATWGGNPANPNTLYVVITVHAPDDPHSGIRAFQYAIGANPGSANLLPWRDYTPVQAGANWFTVPTPMIQPGMPLFIQLRTVNGAGLPSAIASASVVVQ